VPRDTHDEFRVALIEMTERLVELALMTQTLKEHRFDASVLAFTFDLVPKIHTRAGTQASPSRGSNLENFKNAESNRLLELITKRESKSTGAGRNWFMKNSRLRSCITRCASRIQQAISKHAVAAAPAGV
jgi:uncharacterized ferritin-like protein (DUF455 family)